MKNGARTICILGLGYIGLPTACLFASQSNHVTGVDLNEDVVNSVNKGQIPLIEPGLQKLLLDALRSNNLIAQRAAGSADVFIIAVPTPLDKEIRMADLRYVRHAARMISEHLRKDNLVILESTVPPGVSENLVLPILEDSGLKAGEDFYFSHCPERAMPGNTVYEMIHNDRIIGGFDRRSSELAKELYSCFTKGSFYLTSLKLAEMVKLLENTFRDTNLALANEFAKIAEESGLNVWEAIELANKHPRVNILNPGPGVGGHCLAIDPWFLTEISSRNRMTLLAREINNSMPYHVLTLVKELLGGLKKGSVVTVLGVAYKGDVDDTREAPALKFIKLAENHGFRVKVHDPCVKKFEYALCAIEEAVLDSDCLVLITDHAQFKNIDPEQILPLVKNKNIVDTRNFLERQKWEKSGFRFLVLGDRSEHSG